MKKFISISLALLLCLMLCSCGKEESGGNTASGESNVSGSVDENLLDTEFTKNDTNSDYDASSAVKTEENSDIITIKDSKTYTVSGKHNQIVVEAGENDKPKIILTDATIKSNDGPAIYIKSADKVFITVPENTQSSISDSENYSEGYDNADGAIFSKSDLTLNGKGTLNVKGNYKCGIVSKDDLVIVDTKIKVESAGCAIEGKDCVKSTGAALTLNAGGDGIKSTNTEDTSRGYVYIQSGSYAITAQNDGIQAESALLIDSGDFTVTTGGGSAVSSSQNDSGWGNWGRPYENGTSSDDTESAKAIKCTTLIKISGGDFTIDSSDDALHSNSDLQIENGTFKISSGDDGIHADDQLIINGGNITVNKSYEGIEATAITVNNGTVNVTASDDGFNAAGGNDSSALGGRPGQNPFESDSDAKIEINGGYILVNASGDGIDSNGNIVISNGVLLVSGPTNSGNGSLDYGGNAYINGGTAIFTGSSGMAESFSQDSKQASVAYTLDSSQSENTLVALTDKDGSVLASFKPEKSFNHIIISTPKTVKGSKYNITLGGSISGADSNGYAVKGKVASPNQTLEIEITEVATSYGNGGMGGGFGGGMGGKPGGHGGGRFY